MRVNESKRVLQKQQRFPLSASAQGRVCTVWGTVKPKADALKEAAVNMVENDISDKSAN